MAESFSAGWSQRYFGEALKNFAKTSEWMHAISGIGVFCAFVTDVLELRFHGITIWALAAILVAAVTAWGLGKVGRIARPTAEKIISFMIFPAAILSCLYVAHIYFRTPSLAKEIVDAVHREEQAVIEAHDRDVAKMISAKVGAPLAAVNKKMEELRAAGGHHDIDAEALAFAKEYVHAATSGIPTDDPEVWALVTAADVDTAGQRFGDARLKMRRVAEMERMASTGYGGRSVAAVQAATNALEHSAWLAEQTEQFLDAAGDYTDGAQLIATIDPHRSWQMTRGQAHELYMQGVRFHDEASARQAVELCTSLVAKAREARWDTDLQASKTDLDKADASLNAILGTHAGPSSKPLPPKPARPIHPARPGLLGQQPARPVVGLPAAPAAPEAQPQQAEGFFARLTGWVNRNSKREAPQANQQIVPKALEGLSRTGPAPISPPRETAPRRSHGGTARKPHTSDQ